ncbi:hypothetical protein MCOR25_002109 [Pyricularia grisea]|uniref:Uncharacterized protein n=1 Tax=Pyricularia grisea TaxID=148305 RepID=A0A6P8B9S9_PYRGI|nr:uncharacterized protein PgNI_03194 [Pyricularia grisea]KAI6379131.1 hypothetical protein MCOR25_002109 [Pyricularia grisea]TLD12427.1 hypothetical protein PgNI_03194 [Pyricularia grisea]
MATQVKEKASASQFEIDTQDHHLKGKVRTIKTLDNVRTGLTILALIMGISILGVSADTLQVYNATSVPPGYEQLLPLWPQNFNLRPTVALVVGAAFVVVANAVSVLCSRIVIVRNRSMIHTSQSLAVPFVGLVAALIAMIFFYAVNASDSEDTLLSWTCRWKTLSMVQNPHFGTLCKESWAGLYLTILLIPVEVAVLAVAAYQAKLEKYASAYTYARDTPSPSTRVGSVREEGA